MTVVASVSITGAGTGRPDYSDHVERAAVTVYKTDQTQVLLASSSISLAVNGSATITVPSPTSGYKTVIRNAVVDIDANELLELQVVDPDANTIKEYGYHAIKFNIPDGIEVEYGETATVTVINRGNTSGVANMIVTGTDERILGVAL